MWSNEVRGWIGVLVAVLFLSILQIFIVKRANESRKHAKLSLFDLIITSEDNCYSLSRFQIYIWTGWIVIAFTAIAFYSCSFPAVPQNVAILMGINSLTTVLSTAISTSPKNEKNLIKQNKPNFYRDIFLDNTGTFDLPRAQMFVWTMVILMTHMFIFWNNYYTTLAPKIPDVDAGLLILMGVSNGAYLGVKAADSNNNIKGSK